MKKKEFLGDYITKRYKFALMEERRDINGKVYYSIIIEKFIFESCDF